MATVTLGELARRLGARVVGDETTEIRGLAGIDEAREGDLTFVANPRYRKGLLRTGASAAIVPPDVGEAPIALLVTPEPYLAFARALEIFHPEERPLPGISPRAWIEPDARIGQGVSIFPFVYVGKEARIGDRAVLYPFVYIGEGARLGDECWIYPNVTVREGCRLGNRVILHSGVVVGADGFGYAQEGERHRKIPQVGIVEIEDDVEVGANACIDRGTMGKTRIGRGTKIDNLVQVAHNVDVGADVILVSQTGISGSTTVGDRAVLAGQVGVVGHIRIGRDVKIGAKSGVHSSIRDGRVVSGIPAMPYEDFLKTIATYRHLPRMRERLRKLEKEVQALRALLGAPSRQGREGEQDHPDQGGPTGRSETEGDEGL